MPKNLIDLPIEAARAVKWQRGRDQYGPVFIGNPLEELDEELLDALNYTEEAARQGFPVAGMAEDLRSLCERTRAIYHAGRGTPDRASHTGRGTIADIRAVCAAGDIAAVLDPRMISRLAALSAVDLAVAKRIVRARFHVDCAPQLFARLIRERRAEIFRAERAKALGSKSGKHSDVKLSTKSSRKVDAMMAAFARRGGLFRGRKGLAAMTAAKQAEVRAAALAGRKRAREKRESAGIIRRPKPDGEAREAARASEEAHRPSVPAKGATVVIRRRGKGLSCDGSVE